ncbi:MAG: hypothetical protein IJC31_07140 [Spirochaetaceae bacterium]|nr:hypothetical protein [Spirochaetaceae bacterium]
MYSITSYGELYTWGNNEFGNIGNGNTNVQTTPHLVGISGRVKNVVTDSSGQTVFAITEDGKLYSWGKNNCGQIGNETTNNQTTPYLVKGIDGKIKDVVSSKGETIYAITEEGKLYSWGKNSTGQVGNGTTEYQTTPCLVIDGKIKNVVSSGRDFVIAITEEGKLFSWGKNNQGQIGDINADDSGLSNQLIPHLVEGIAGKVKDLIINDNTVFAITEEGKLFSWGNNQKGQVGNNSYDDMIKSPQEVLIGVKVKNVFISFNETVYAVTEEGKLYSWGNNINGQVGNNKSADNLKQIEPHLVGISGKVKDIVLGPYTVFVITEEGELYSWGLNNFGQVGNGTDSGIQATPVKINLASKKVISVGYNNVLDSVYAITEDGYLYGWGNNPYPYNLLCYSNSNDSSSSPRLVNIEKNIKKIFTNAKNTTYALTEDNRLYSWGYNDYGELGNGESKTKIVQKPYELTTVGKVKDVIIQPDSYDTTKERATVYTITEDNRIYAWGFNDKGQVGNGKSGDDEKQTTPYEIVLP